MALYTKRKFYKRETGIKFDELYRTSRMVSSLTGMQVQHNKAVVGKNAFLHESGIHQDGVLKEHTTYEIMNTADRHPPETIVLGKHRASCLRERLAELGYMMADEELDKAFSRFKDIADPRKRSRT